MAQMDRLVELFVQSARYGVDGEPSTLSAKPVDGGHLDEEGIEHGVEAIMKMLSSDDGLRMGANPAATFMCLAMALEEKPLLQLGAVKCYEKALQIFDKMRERLGEETGGSWERATLLQQLGAVCLKQNLPKEAACWLHECGAECATAEGHPREAVLFQGAFNTSQTRLDFVGQVEKLNVKAYNDLGNTQRARQHYEELQRLSRMQSGDAVERAMANDASQAPKAQAEKDTSVAANAKLDPKALWAAIPTEERSLSEYRFIDEGATVSLHLDLNDHLGIGAEASNAVISLAQFRVNCESECLNVCLRLQRENGNVCQFQLLLQPLAHEVIPEDTVPRLKGKDGKRRLEVKMFKRDKKQSWSHDLVRKQEPKVKGNARASATQAKADEAPLDSMLNPMSAEQLAKLPRPFCGSGDNRPSSWQEGPTLLHTADAKLSPPRSVKAATSASSAAEPIEYPAWVSHVDERRPATGGLEFDVHLGPDAGDSVGMADLELEGDEVLGLRLQLRGALGSPLKLSTPPGTDYDALQARWRRKTRVLELRLP